MTVSVNASFYQAVPKPDGTTDSHQQAVDALKNNVEVLTGQRLPKRASAVTWQDLLNLGLITPLQMPS